MNRLFLIFRQLLAKGIFDGIDRVKACLMGWPASFLGIVGSEEALKPEWPNDA